MQRILIGLGFILISTSLQASLQPGWKQAGWLTNIDEARKVAHTQEKPVFMYFDASWCSWCQQYKREVLDTDEVQAELADHYIRLVIDYDARPDLFTHHRGRGLPYTVILSPDGEELNRFVGILKKPDLLATLNQFRSSGKQPISSLDSIFDTVRVKGLDASAYGDFRAAFFEHIESLYSTELKTLAGQYDTGATLKRPSPLTWMWLLEQRAWQRRAVLATRIEANRLWDRVDGGFFQYLHVRPSSPDYLESSKLLEVNARLSQWMARASEHDNKLASIARKGVMYLTSTLRDPVTGGFFQAQVADQVYYQLSPTLRRQKKPPPVDSMIRLDTNAQVVVSLVEISQLLNDPALLDIADTTYRFLFNGMIKDDRRYHLYEAGRLQVPARLADELWLLAAAIELQRVAPTRKRATEITRLTRGVADRINAAGKKDSPDVMTTELYGLLAWVAIDPLTDPAMDLQLAGQAIRQLSISADTAPDSLIIGLRAWKRMLAK